MLEKISRGVMVNNVFGGPTVMARLWMSGSVTPLVDDLPRLAAVLAVPHAVYFEAGPDVLVVDRPAKIMLGSTGSMARAQMGISFMGESSRSQCCPLSSLRYTPLSRHST